MRRVLFISGAGLSVESGIRAFRTDTATGKAMWDEYNIEEVCDIHAFRGNFYHKTHMFYNKRREELKTVEPNLAHLRIGEWYKQYPGQVVNLTTNVDDLIERAGVPHSDILHIHGYLKEVIVADSYNSSNKRIINVGYNSIDPEDFEWVKPNVIFFGEAAPAYAEMYNVFDGITSEDMIIIVGASNQVINFYWDLFPVLNRTGAKLMVVNYHDSTKASEVDYAGMTRSDMYQLEERGIPYWYKGAVDAFSDPEFIERVEAHLEGRPYIANK
ncbi:hypothetical protein DS691_20980 [Salmonella enterica subsp. enterica serovar Bareilly]|nr:hypothetical protein [Salmonella enterica subsp. enterica serovar Bareilly]